MQNMLLRPVHPMSELGEDPMNVLEACAKDDGLVSVFEKRQLHHQTILSGTPVAEQA